MLEFLLQGLADYGPLVLGLAMLPGAVGLPVPVGMLLIAAGALVRQGSIAWQAAFLFAWLGALASDALCYTLGRRTRRWARGRLRERYDTVWHQAEELFRKNGGWAVFATSWLVRGLAIPTVLIAGSSRYSFWRFLAWDAVGKLFWILLHAGLGYAFASQWKLVGEAIGRFGSYLGLGAILAGSIYLLLRRLRANQDHAAGNAL